MLPDLTPIFTRYESLLAELDATFSRVNTAHPGCVTCAPGCSDCCHALFDLSLVEAIYINTYFKERFDFGPERSAILEAAGDADRRIYKIKHRIFKESQEGKTSAAVMDEVARLRVRCPLLGADDQCRMYDKRPATCRIYGIPTRIGGSAHSCHASAFEPGQSYPAVDMQKLAERLEILSTELAVALKSSYTELDNIFVPLSMALLSSYDEEYLGIRKTEG